MFVLTESARTELDAFFADKKKEAIRMYLAPGGCIRACVSMLEKKGGCMEGRFKEPLRTGKPWKMDR